jgi:hypothetical protein
MQQASEHLELTALLAFLRKEQSASTERAIYIGWTPASMAEHDKRSDLIDLIVLD